MRIQPLPLLLLTLTIVLAACQTSADARKTGGALGRRIDRVWSSDRFMVLVGITEKDGMHVIYFRDRATNDPLLIAKFAPYKTD